MNAINGYDIEDLTVGMSASFTKTLTDADITMFVGVSGDNNAVHIDDEFAASTPFKGRIAHGILTASFISAAIANRLPGPGVIYLGQNLKFKAPVRPGDTIEGYAQVREVYEKTGRSGRMVFVVRSTRYANQHGEDVAAVEQTSAHRRVQPAAEGE